MWYNIKVVERWPVGQAVKTLASHAGNSGSIPGWVTIKKDTRLSVFFCAHSRDQTRRLGGRQCFASLLSIRRITKQTDAQRVGKQNLLT